MPDSPERPILRQSHLRDRLVIDLDTAEEIGRLAHFVVDAKTHQLEGFVCRTGFLGRDRVPIAWVQVESVGRDSILVRRGRDVISEKFDDAIEFASQEIWTDAGNRVGQLVDYCIALDTGAITAYLFTAPGWQGLTEGIYEFSPSVVVSAGRKRMMVQYAALEQAAKFAEGLPDRVAEAWQQDVAQTHQDVQTVVNTTQELADQVQTQAKKIGGQARSQMKQLFGQVKQRTKNLRSQVNEQFADAAASLQARQEPRRSDAIPGHTIDVDSQEVWLDDDTPPTDTPKPPTPPST
ncbi:MAG: PRC-barrel domain-containing protein [Leptolyngbyaceae cyanobacterium T60_A2020_046]|nr:PRC-barrel domain-containing protein [Leptolyngbyaceae cyanobacterium T60_A2020_046]